MLVVWYRDINGIPPVVICLVRIRTADLLEHRSKLFRAFHRNVLDVSLGHQEVAQPRIQIQLLQCSHVRVVSDDLTER